MRHHEFVRRVAEISGISIDDQEALTQGINATLGTLGEILDDDEVGRLATELPPDLRPALNRFRGEPRGPHAGMPPGDLDEFSDRVMTRSETGKRDAGKMAVAVMQVIGEAVSDGTFHMMNEALPFTIADLARREGVTLHR